MVTHTLIDFADAVVVGASPHPSITIEAMFFKRDVVALASQIKRPLLLLPAGKMIHHLPPPPLISMAYNSVGFVFADLSVKRMPSVSGVSQLFKDLTEESASPPCRCVSLGMMLYTDADSLLLLLPGLCRAF